MINQFKFYKNYTFLLWLCTIALFTIFVKYYYFDLIYSNGFTAALKYYLANETLLGYIKTFFLMFGKSILEAIIFSSILHFLLHVLLGINQKIVIFFSSLLLFLFAIANQMTLQNIQSLLTYDSMMIAIDWIINSPQDILEYITPINLVYLILSFLFIIIPLWINPSKIKKIILFILIPFIIFSLISYVYLFTSNSTFNKQPLQGYWSLLFSSFINTKNKPLNKKDVLPLKNLKSNYHKIIKVPNIKDKPLFISNAIKPMKKHLIIIGLETAPMKYYPILDNPKLPNFYKMSQKSILSYNHYTAAPYTTYAYYTLLTGTYVPPNIKNTDYKNMYFNGLANILSKEYTARYLDSFYVDWHGGNTFRTLFHSYGFQHIFDRDNYTKTQTKKQKKLLKINGFEYDLFSEKIAFNKIIDCIDTSIKENRKALVFAATALGHYSWKATKENKQLSNPKKIFNMAKSLDLLFGKLLKNLQEKGYENDVIIAVTGDHGLRYHKEFQSLHEDDSNVKVGFNVPLMIYMPGQLSHKIKLPYPTSHIDITPSLLEFVGVDTSKYFFHGENILHSRLKNRRIFFMNQTLKPISSFLEKNKIYTHNFLNNESSTTSLKATEKLKLQNDNNLSDKEIQTIIKKAKDSFDDLGTYYLYQKCNCSHNTKIAYLVSQGTDCFVSTNQKFKWNKNSDIKNIKFTIWDKNENKEIFSTYTEAWNIKIKLPQNHKIKITLTSYNSRGNQIRDMNTYNFVVR